MDLVAHVDGTPVDQSPGELFAVENTPLAVGIGPKDIVLMFDQIAFRVISSTSGRLFTPLFLAFVLVEAVVLSKLRLLGRLCLGLARKEFLQFFHLGFKLSDTLGLLLDRISLLLDRIVALLQLVLILACSHARKLHEISRQEKSSLAIAQENGQLRQNLY